jgi:hypothetical protein
VSLSHPEASIHASVAFAISVSSEEVLTCVYFEKGDPTSPVFPISEPIDQITPRISGGVAAKFETPTLVQASICAVVNSLALSPVMEGTLVGAGGGVAVGRAVGVAVGRAVGVAVGRAIGVAVGRAIGVAVGRAIGVAVGRAIGVAVGRGGSVGVSVGLGVDVGGDGVRAGCDVAVDSGTGVQVGVADGRATNASASTLV